MRKAKILYKDEAAGILTQYDNGSFTFRYDDDWLNNSQKSAISLTLPKSSQAYHSDYLFSFFYQMLPEGPNKDVICKHHRIDKNDDFGLLTIATLHDAIGAVNVIKI